MGLDHNDKSTVLRVYNSDISKQDVERFVLSFAKYRGQTYALNFSQVFASNMSDSDLLHFINCQKVFNQWVARGGTQEKKELIQRSFHALFQLYLSSSKELRNLVIEAGLKVLMILEYAHVLELYPLFFESYSKSFNIDWVKKQVPTIVANLYEQFLYETEYYVGQPHHLMMPDERMLSTEAQIFMVKKPQVIAFLDQDAFKEHLEQYRDNRESMESLTNGCSYIAQEKMGDLLLDRMFPLPLSNEKNVDTYPGASAPPLLEECSQPTASAVPFAVAAPIAVEAVPYEPQPSQNNSRNNTGSVFAMLWGSRSSNSEMRPQELVDGSSKDPSAPPSDHSKSGYR